MIESGKKLDNRKNGGIYGCISWWKVWAFFEDENDQDCTNVYLLDGNMIKVRIPFKFMYKSYDEYLKSKKEKEGDKYAIEEMSLIFHND